MKLTKYESGYRLELYGYEVHNLNLTLNKCRMEYYNYLIWKRNLNTKRSHEPHIDKTYIDVYTEWSSEFKKRISNDFYVNDKDIYYILMALEYSIVVDKYHAQFICEFRDSLHKKILEERISS